MKAKIGMYFFCRKRNYWGIYQYDTVNEQTGATSASHIDDTYDYEDAVKIVYNLNGWVEPKHITRKF